MSVVNLDFYFVLRINKSYARNIITSSDILDLATTIFDLVTPFRSSFFNFVL